MATVGRPREKNVSKWGVWKRQQRAGTRGARCSRCGSSAQLVQHHTAGTPHKPGTITLCRSCHGKHHG